MVFLIQNTQNRDGAAIQAKLDELVRVSAGSNQFNGIENLPQEEIDEFRAKRETAVKKAKSAQRRAKQKQKGPLMKLHRMGAITLTSEMSHSEPLMECGLAPAH